LRAGHQPRQLRDGAEGGDTGHPHAGGGVRPDRTGRAAGARLRPDAGGFCARGTAGGLQPSGAPHFVTLRISIETVWRFTKEHDARSMRVMLDFLNEIRATGKITRAAERAEVSYRHAWNLIGQWSDFFGTPLVDRRQGRGTRLTAFGERLVWAGQRLQARLGPQLQNLAQELESEVNTLLAGGGEVVRIHASHG